MNEAKRLLIECYQNAETHKRATHKQLFWATFNSLNNSFEERSNELYENYFALANHNMIVLLISSIQHVFVFWIN